MTPVERATRRTFRSLRTRNFRLYFLGQVISGTGTWLQFIAQSWLVFRLTHSGVAVGLTLALQFTPMLLLGAWGGLLVDRLDKRRVLVFTAAASGALALALGLVTVAGAAEVWMVYALAFALGIVTAIDHPARRAFVPEMVPVRDVANAVGLNSTVFTTARVIGPAIAGILIASVGVGWCFIANAVSYVAVVWALGAMRSSELRRSTPVPAGSRQLREGLQYAWGNRPVRLALLMTAVVATLAFNFQVVLPLLARRELGGDAETFGTLMALLGAGSLAGALWVSHYGRASTRVMTTASFALTASMAAAALAPTLAVEMAVLPVVGLTSMILIAMATAICNEQTAPELRGRVMALFGIAFLGSTPIGGPLIGWIAQTAGPREALWVGALAALTAGAVAVAATRHRNLEETSATARPGTDDLGLAEEQAA